MHTTPSKCDNYVRDLFPKLAIAELLFAGTVKVQGVNEVLNDGTRATKDASIHEIDRVMNIFTLCSGSESNPSTLLYDNDSCANIPWM